MSHALMRHVDIIRVSFGLHPAGCRSRMNLEVAVLQQGVIDYLRNAISRSGAGEERSKYICKHL